MHSPHPSSESWPVTALPTASPELPISDTSPMLRAPSWRLPYTHHRKTPGDVCLSRLFQRMSSQRWDMQMAIWMPWVSCDTGMGAAGVLSEPSCYGKAGSTQLCFQMSIHAQMSKRNDDQPTLPPIILVLFNIRLPSSWNNLNPESPWAQQAPQNNLCLTQWWSDKGKAGASRETQGEQPLFEAHSLRVCRL